MKHIFIVNQISGKGKALSLVDTVKKIAEEKAIDYIIEITEKPGHAEELARKYCKDDNILYAVGGDGTILEVLNGIDDSHQLGIIPAGSGNDFYRLIGPKIDNYEQVISDTIGAEAKRIDIGVNDKIRFLNVTSFGIDADVNDYASFLIRKTIFNKDMAYILGILKNVIVFHPKHLKLDIDGKKVEDDFLVVAIMNGRYYGNGVPSAPNSDIQDGYFDICLLRNIPKLKAYNFLAHYLKGKHLGMEGFEIIRAKKIKIEADSLISVQSDGENFKVDKMTCEIKKDFLLLKVPSYLDIIH